MRNNLRRVATSLSVAALVLTVGGASALADPVWSFTDDFESNSVGADPAGWALSESNVGLVTVGDGAAIQVVAGHATANADPGDDRLMQFHATVNSSPTAYWAANKNLAATITPADPAFTFSFKFMVPSTANGGTDPTDFSLVLRNGSHPSWNGLGLRIRGGGTNTISRLTTGGNSVLLATLVRDAWYQFSGTVDLASSTTSYELKLDNLEAAYVGDVNQHKLVSAADLVYSAPLNQVYFARTAGVTSTANILVDDVALTLVPEPASMALLASGGLLMLARHRHPW